MDLEITKINRIKSKYWKR